MAPTYRLPDYIFVDFCRDLALEFQESSNMEFAVSGGKNGPIATEWRPTIVIEL